MSTLDEKPGLIAPQLVVINREEYQVWVQQRGTRWYGWAQKIAPHEPVFGLSRPAWTTAQEAIEGIQADIKREL